MNLCIVNEDHPQCNVPRKVIKAGPGKGWGPLSHLESGHAVPFSRQDFCSVCELGPHSYNTQTLWAGVHIIKQGR